MLVMKKDIAIRKIVAKLDDRNYIVEYNGPLTQTITNINVIPSILLNSARVHEIRDIHRETELEDVKFYIVELTDGSMANIKTSLVGILLPSSGDTPCAGVDDAAAPNAAPSDEAGESNTFDITEGVGNMEIVNCDEPEDDTYYEIEKIIDERTVDGKTEYLVKWCNKGHICYDNSWCPEKDMSEYALEVHRRNKRVKLHNNDHSFGRRAYLYVRTSGHKDIINVATSIPIQIDEVFKYISHKNYKALGLYVDNGCSAKCMDNQIELNNILDDIESNDMHDCVIVMYDTSRFSRSLIKALQVIDMLFKRRIFIEFINENMTTENVSHHQLIEHKLSDAQALSMLVSEKVKVSIARRKAAGMAIGRIPYGMKRVDGKDVANPDELEIVRFIYSIRSRGYPSILESLKCEGYSYRGKPWTVGIVFNILATIKKSSRGCADNYTYKGMPLA
jgi:DNA invertase Pin-like site-specific DNA recombinase